MDNQNLSTENNQQSDDISNALDLLEASRLAATGNLDEAETLLCHGGNLPGSCAALDLLARISVQKGQFVHARRLWLMVLEKDPTHESVKAALAKLGTPWIAFALAKRASFLAGVSVLLFLSAFGLVAAYFGNVRPETETIPTPIPTVLPMVVVQPNDISATERRQKLTEPVMHVAPPLFVVSGCSISTNKSETRIVFNDGLFSSHCKFTESAQERLTSLANILATKATNCWIIVEGHTDSDPMPANSRYRDNYALGLHRALSVADVLMATMTIPYARIRTTSSGDIAPPFIGTDNETKSRNRTVVIRLVPSESVTTEEWSTTK